MYWLNFWPWHGWFGLPVCVFALKSTDWISDHDMVDLNSQSVCNLLSNLLTWFLTVTWMIWTLSKCVIGSQIYWHNFWWWHGWFGLLVCVWFALKSTDPISDCEMVNLDSQLVRELDSQWVCNLFSNILTLFLTMLQLIWTFRMCVICSQIHWPDFWLWYGWFGLSAIVWFALKCTESISDHATVGLDF